MTVQWDAINKDYVEWRQRATDLMMIAIAWQMTTLTTMMTARQKTTSMMMAFVATGNKFDDDGNNATGDKVDKDGKFATGDKLDNDGECQQ